MTLAPANVSFGIAPHGRRHPCEGIETCEGIE